MMIKFINLKELLESLILVINLKKNIKRYNGVKYNMDIRGSGWGGGSGIHYSLKI